ncbi:MAG: SpoIIE family protein phosphatase [Acidimicrobiales bacterium]
MVDPVDRPWSRNLAVVLLLAVPGVVATALSIDGARDEAHARDERAVALVTERLSARLSDASTSLLGTDLLAADGEVTADELDVFVEDIQPVTDFRAIAFEQVVPADEADEWQEATGIRITESDGAGGFVPATGDDVHYPVRFVSPDTDDNRRVIGFDIGSDEVRRTGVEQATQVEEPALAGPIALAGNGRPGLFLIRAVRGTDDAVVGYVSSGIGVADLVQQVADIPHLDDVGLSVDGTLVSGVDGGDATSSFDLGGRTITVTAGDTRGVNPLVPVSLGATTLVVCGLAEWSASRGRRARRREREFAQREIDLQRAVVQTLQASLLTDTPEVSGYELAVAYRSAMRSVGIGGDWYSVIEHGDALFAVVGDIAGHGPGAVAIMAEVKTIIRHLLSTGASIEEVLEHAERSLERRRAYGSVVIARIDRSCGAVTLANAGHPSPIVVSGGAARRFDTVHRPWLGVAGVAAPLTHFDLEPGDTLLLYTDGLIEERGEPIDRSIDELAARVARDVADAGDVHGLTERLLIHRDADRSDATVDDDIAILAIHRRRT